MQRDNDPWSIASDVFASSGISRFVPGVSSIFGAARNVHAMYQRVSAMNERRQAFEARLAEIAAARSGPPAPAGIPSAASGTATSQAATGVQFVGASSPPGVPIARKAGVPIAQVAPQSIAEIAPPPVAQVTPPPVAVPVAQAVGNTASGASAAAGSASAAGASGVSAVAPVLMGAAIVGSAVLLTEEIIRRTSGFAQRRAAELAPFSPDIAAASARSDVSRLLTAVEQGQKYGPTMAAFENAKSHFDTAVTKFTDAAMKPLIEAVTSILRLSEPFIKKATALMEHPLVKLFIQENLRALNSMEALAEHMGIIKKEIERSQSIVPWFDQQPFLEPSARWAAIFGKHSREIDQKQLTFDATFTRNGLRF